MCVCIYILLFMFSSVVDCRDAELRPLCPAAGPRCLSTLHTPFASADPSPHLPMPLPATTLFSTAESVSCSEISGICLSLSDFISMKISSSLHLAPNVEASVFKWLVCCIPFLFRSSCLTLVSVPKFPKRCRRGNLWLVPPTGWHPR